MSAQTSSGPTNGRSKGLVSRGEVPSSQCVAIAHGSGKRCAKWAIVGGTVCPTHGGNAPQVREKARQRIAALAPRALVVLREIMEDKGAPAAARVRAAADLLDRGGYKAAEEIIVSPGQPNAELDDAIRTALQQRALGQGSQARNPIAADDGSSGPDDGAPDGSSGGLCSPGPNLPTADEVPAEPYLVPQD